jgi:hypothetical protein
MHEPKAPQEWLHDLALDELDENDLAAYLSDVAGTDPPWRHVDLPGEASDELTTDGLGPDEPAAGDDGAGGAEGTIPPVFA